MPATQFNLIGNGNLQMGLDMDHHPVRSFAVFGIGGLNSKIALTAAGWSLPTENTKVGFLHHDGCGVKFLCMWSEKTGVAGKLTATLPNYNGVVVVRWGKPYSSSNARLYVGGDKVEELSGGVVDEVTTRVAFAANDMIRFEEDDAVVSVSRSRCWCHRTFSKCREKTARWHQHRD